MGSLRGEQAIPYISVFCLTSFLHSRESLPCSRICLTTLSHRLVSLIRLMGLLRRAASPTAAGHLHPVLCQRSGTVPPRCALPYCLDIAEPVRCDHMPSRPSRLGEMCACYGARTSRKGMSDLVDLGKSRIETMLKRLR